MAPVRVLKSPSERSHPQAFQARCFSENTGFSLGDDVLNNNNHGVFFHSKYIERIKRTKTCDGTLLEMCVFLRGFALTHCSKETKKTCIFVEAHSIPYHLRHPNWFFPG